MTLDTLFIDSRHTTSLRYGVFEDDGTSAWLYLTECHSHNPVSDVWVHNRIPAPPMGKIENYYGGPPPAAIGFTNNDTICKSPTESKWYFIWSTDGHAVALVQDDQPVAFVIAASKHGFSRNLISSGPWGNVWETALFNRTFEGGSIAR